MVQNNTTSQATTQSTSKSCHKWSGNIRTNCDQSAAFAFTWLSLAWQSQVLPISPHGLLMFAACVNRRIADITPHLIILHMWFCRCVKEASERQDVCCGLAGRRTPEWPADSQHCAQVYNHSVGSPVQFPLLAVAQCYCVCRGGARTAGMTDAQRARLIRIRELSVCE